MFLNYMFKTYRFSILNHYLRFKPFANRCVKACTHEMRKEENMDLCRYFSESESDNRNHS